MGDGSNDEVVLNVPAGADAIANEGYSGVVLAGKNCGASIDALTLVYLDGTTAEWIAADSDTAAGPLGPARGITVAACTDGNPGTVLVQGTIRHDAWTWTDEGQDLYLSGTAAASNLTETAPSTSGDMVQHVGFSLTDDEVYVNFSGHWLIVE